MYTKIGLIGTGRIAKRAVRELMTINEIAIVAV